jgi:hypothetical protein
VPETGNNLTAPVEGKEILSIRLSTDGFSFYIYNPLYNSTRLSVTKEVNASISITANLKSLFADMDILHAAYARVNIVVSGQRYTYVPQELLEHGQEEAVFHYNQRHVDNEAVLCNELQNCSATVIFGLDRSTLSFVREHFPSVGVYSQSALLCESFAVRSRQNAQRKLYVHFRGDGIDIFAFDQGNLLLANSYEVSREADISYYILATWQRLSLNQETDELYLAGQQDKWPAVSAELKRYVNRVNTMPEEADIDIQELNIDYANN